MDGSGNVYVAGNDFATWGSPVRPFTTAPGRPDVFVAKPDSGGALTWNTFLGGSGDDYGFGIAVDGSGNVYVVGPSTATWGAPVRTYTAGTDAFVVQIQDPPPCAASPSNPTNGTYASCAGTASGGTCALTCNAAYTKDADATCTAGTWSTRSCTLVNGQTCSSDPQCASGVCMSGSCGRALGQACSAGTECVSNVCSAGTCQGLNNGQSCSSSGQCTSGSCAGGTCGAVGVPTLSEWGIIVFSCLALVFVIWHTRGRNARLGAS